MNVSVHIFGSLGAGYTQFPDDHTRELFAPLEAHLAGEAGLYVRRRGSVVHYAYVRRLAASEASAGGRSTYLGIGLTYNGVMPTDAARLCRECEAAVTAMVTEGGVIRFAADGSITPCTDMLWKAAAEFRQFASLVAARFSADDFGFTTLGAANYAVSAEAVKSLSTASLVDDAAAAMSRDVASALADYHNVNVTVGQSGGALGRYGAVLRRLYDENTALKADLAKVRRQKKQVGWVVFLLLMLAAGGVAMWLVNDDLDSTRRRLRYATEELDEKQQTVDALRADVESGNVKISELSAQVTWFENQLEEEQEALEEEREAYAATCQMLADVQDAVATLPIVITRMDVANVASNGNVISDYGEAIHSRYTQCLSPRIFVTAIRTSQASASLRVKLYRHDDYGNEELVQDGYRGIKIVSGSNLEYQLPGFGGSKSGHYSAGTYRFEMWYGCVRLATQSFSIW